MQQHTRGDAAGGSPASTSEETAETVALPSTQQIASTATSLHSTAIDEIVTALSHALGKREQGEARIEPPSYEYRAALWAFTKDVELETAVLEGWSKDLIGHLDELTHIRSESPDAA